MAFTLPTLEKSISVASSCSPIPSRNRYLHVMCVSDHITACYDLT